LNRFQILNEFHVWLTLQRAFYFHGFQERVDVAEKELVLIVYARKISINKASLKKNSNSLFRQVRSFHGFYIWPHGSDKERGEWPQN
jgi:hypothetical protein